MNALILIRTGSAAEAVALGAVFGDVDVVDDVDDVVGDDDDVVGDCDVVGEDVVASVVVGVVDVPHPATATDSTAAEMVSCPRSPGLVLMLGSLLRSGCAGGYSVQQAKTPVATA